MSDSINGAWKKEGGALCDLGKWGTLPLSHQLQKYFVWLCFYGSVTNEILKPVIVWKLDQLQKYSRLLLASIATLDVITNRKEKVEVEVSSWKKQK